MNQGRLIALIVAAAVPLLLVLWGTFTVHQSEQALVLRLGEPQRVITEPGLNFKVPLVDDTVFFSKRVLNVDAPPSDAPPTEVQTLDEKRVIVSAFARFKIVDPLLFFQTVNNESGAEDRLLRVISSSLREVLGEVPMLDILTEKRAVYMRQIAEKVIENSKAFGIEVIDVRMKRVDLPETNSEAVFARMRAERQAEAKQIRAEGENAAQTIRAKADKTATVTLAEAHKTSSIQRGLGDAEATRVYNDAYGRDPAFFDFFRSMQAMNESLSGDTTTYVGPPTGDFFRYFGDQRGAASATAPKP